MAYETLWAITITKAGERKASVLSVHENLGLAELALFDILNAFCKRGKTCTVVGRRIVVLLGYKRSPEEGGKPVQFVRETYNIVALQELLKEGYIV